jgi:sulfite reductase alpha subunit-like flavoprotein
MPPALPLAMCPLWPVVASATPAVAAATALRVSVLYGSQTGNAKREAERLADALRGEGADVRLVRADAYPTRELGDERVLFVVISTQGEGEPPDDARGFVEFVSGRRAPKLEQLQFAVLGLGDSSYPQFNAMGRALDARFEALGAKRLFPRGDADVDVATVAVPWLTQAREQVRALKPANAPTTVPSSAATSAAHDAWHKEQPYTAELLTNQRITARESVQDVRHLEILLDPSLSYEPGDALGVKPRNAAAMVERLVARLGWSGHESVRIGDEIRSAHDWLVGHRELTRLHRGFLARRACTRCSIAFQPVDDVPWATPGEAHLGDEAHPSRCCATKSHSVRSTAPLRAIWPTQRGRSAAGLCRSQRALPPAGRRVARHHHDRPGHRRGAVPRLRAGTRGRRRSGRNWLFFGARHARRSSSTNSNGRPR